MENCGLNYRRLEGVLRKVGKKHNKKHTLNKMYAYNVFIKGKCILGE